MPAPSPTDILDAPPALTPSAERQFPFVARGFRAQAIVAGGLTRRTPLPKDHADDVNHVE